MRRILSRRTFLYGTGGVVIGLPFLEEMRPRVARAAAAEPPMRLITLFFGLGVARDEMLKKFTGPLEPYQPFANKMAIFTNLELKPSHELGSGARHLKDGDVACVGER